MPVTALPFVNDRAEQFRIFSFQYVQIVILLELFVFAFASCIDVFGSAVSALKHVDTSFNGTVHGSSSFLMLCLGVASDKTIDQNLEQTVIFACVATF